MATNKYASLDLGTIEAVFNKLGGIKGAQAFLRDETKVVPNEAVVKEGVPLNTIIHVDRKIRPTYPDWVKKVLHPKLENTGPTDYDLAKDVTLWLHDKQKNGGVTTGNVIYDYLKKNNILESCGSLQDALAIQKLGLATFNKAFGNKVIYFWKSVVQDHGGHLNIPYLCVSDGRVVLHWYWLDDDCGPAVRFASS